MAITKREKFEIISSVFADMNKSWNIGEETLTAHDLVDFCTHEIEMLANRKRSDSKPTKGQQENELIKKNILALLADGVGRTATEVMIALELSSNQKATALLNQLYKNGKITKTKEKKVTKFIIA